ncbi:MAG: hypothetical protein KDA79_15615 [Planctomycetaceae bacterium]|nr:hypothetical protein [Planctomycetaceae bacterium]
MFSLAEAHAADRAGANCIRIEAFVRAESEHSAAAHRYLRALERRWPGLKVEVSDVTKDQQAYRRAQQLLRSHRIRKPGLPIIHACGQLLVGFSRETTGKQIEQLLTIDVYTRAGCPHCAAGKAFLSRIRQRYPGFLIVDHDIISKPGAREELQELLRSHNVTAGSTPVFHLCGQLIVGYLGDDSSGRRIERLLQQSCVPCRDGVSQLSQMNHVLVSWQPSSESGPAAGGQADDFPPADEPIDDFPLEDIPLEDLPAEGTSGEKQPAQPPAAPGGVDLPVFGPVNVRRVGLPLFTVAIGLVDGFNPCAMWVLLFLLSILVNMKDRRKILAVAGTFVLVSGLAYFAFMAAWLNVFLLVGYLRVSQIILGLLALSVGAIHIKDFFAAGRGISLSIPAAAKPGIYARVRQIVTAEHLTGAVAGAIVLAVLVNVIELLCTAGLPALYTQILSQQQLETWQVYGYLGLYNLAYMFDDSLMVAIVVVTLGRHKLQEHQGRWLKLMSGLVVLLLGLLLLFRPEWLM